MTRPRNKSVSAAIFDSRFGHELRIYYGQDENNIVSTTLSRTGDEPLEHEASQIRAVLEVQGWVAAGATAR
jgi:hypothetical protein